MIPKAYQATLLDLCYASGNVAIEQWVKSYLSAEISYRLKTATENANPAIPEHPDTIDVGTMVVVVRGRKVPIGTRGMVQSMREATYGEEKTTHVQIIDTNMRKWDTYLRNIEMVPEHVFVPGTRVYVASEKMYAVIAPGRSSIPSVLFNVVYENEPGKVREVDVKDMFVATPLQPGDDVWVCGDTGSTYRVEEVNTDPLKPFVVAPEDICLDGIGERLWTIFAEKMYDTLTPQEAVKELNSRSTTTT